MVFVQVELANTMQVQDLLSFLLARSYNNFRVTDKDLFALGVQSTIASAPSPIAIRPPCPPPVSQLSSLTSRICENSPPPPLLPALKAATAQFPTTSTPRQNEQKPASHQKSVLEATTVMSSIFSNSQSTDLMADDDTDENDLSIDNPSEVHNHTMMEEDDEISELIVKNVPENDLLGIKQLCNEITRLRKGNLLKGKTQCAVCDEKCEVRSHAEEFLSHVNRKHARFHMFGCAHCSFSATTRSSTLKHLRKHKLAVNGNVQQILKAHIISLPLTMEHTRRLRELTEACFGVRWR